MHRCTPKCFYLLTAKLKQMKEKGRLFGFSSYLKEHLISSKSNENGEPVERQVEYLVKEHLEMTYPGICSPNPAPEESAQS